MVLWEIPRKIIVLLLVYIFDSQTCMLVLVYCAGVRVVSKSTSFVLSIFQCAVFKVVKVNIIIVMGNV